ncbi:MAG: hypothetical protein HY720_12150 [Planctomycetes bacterium]|nr:hypothetical protein [Planctomycetota bacterium]
MQDRELAQYLVKENLVVKDRMQKAIEMQKTIGGSLGQILVKLGFITDEHLSKAVARAEGLPFEDIGDLILPQALINSIPRDIIEKHQVIPIHRDEDSITLAVTDPLDVEAIDEITFLTGKRVGTVMASKEQIRRAITRFYYDEEGGESSLLGEAGTATIGGEAVPQWKLKQALIPLLIEKGIITEQEILAKAKEL